jgi:hypothetical protein
VARPRSVNRTTQGVRHSVTTALGEGRAESGLADQGVEATKGNSMKTVIFRKLSRISQ